MTKKCWKQIVVYICEKSRSSSPLCGMIKKWLPYLMLEFIWFCRLSNLHLNSGLVCLFVCVFTSAELFSQSKQLPSSLGGSFFDPSFILAWPCSQKRAGEHWKRCRLVLWLDVGLLFCCGACLADSRRLGGDWFRLPAAANCELFILPCNCCVSMFVPCPPSCCSLYVVAQRFYIVQQAD